MSNPSAPGDRAGSAADPAPSPAPIAPPVAADALPVEDAPKPPVRLLLVDDEPGLRTAVKAYLEDEGFEVNTANDGEEGWTQAQQLHPDVVITDVMMPRCDGFGLLKRLRADERLGGTPVIFLTAKGMTADRIAGFQAGADDYIPKPFDPDELVARVHNVVRRQERLLAEAARYADADIGAMARQITEIRSMLGTGGGGGGGGGGVRKAPPDVQLDFTPREASVLQLVAEGMMNKEIARRLETSIRNVEKYVSRLFIKTGTASRTELVRYALEHGLVE
jgi:DNA-binding NarL/FixJ family response regulator